MRFEGRLRCQFGRVNKQELSPVQRVVAYARRRVAAIRCRVRIQLGVLRRCESSAPWPLCFWVVRSLLSVRSVGQVRDCDVVVDQERAFCSLEVDDGDVVLNHRREHVATGGGKSAPRGEFAV